MSIDYITLAAARRRAKILIEEASIKGVDLSEYLKKDETLALLNLKQDKINFSEPSTPKDNEFWLDSSSSPFTLKVYLNNKWETICGGSSSDSSISFDDWDINTKYEKDDYVIYDNKLYQAINSHTSTSDFNDDINNWKLIIGCKLDEYYKKGINDDGSIYIMLGDKIISGVKKETVTKTITDQDTGNVSTITIKTEQSPTFTFKETEIITIESSTGNTITSIEKTLSGSDGSNIGTASGERTVIITDPSGTEISNETEAVQYINGSTDAFMDIDEGVDMADIIADELNWRTYINNSDSLMTKEEIDKIDRKSVV